MDKSEFVQKAPLYYALAIAYIFSDNDVPRTRRFIQEQFFTYDEDGQIHYGLLNSHPLWDRAIAWLAKERMIEAHEDAFGPSIYVPTDGFHDRWQTLCETTPPFKTAQSGGDIRSWINDALEAIVDKEEELEIEDSDFDKPESEWEPIPLEKEDESLHKAIDSLERTIAAVEESNGYAVEYPEERAYVLDNLRLLSTKLKTATSISVGYVKSHGLTVLKRLQDRFIDTAIGAIAKQTTAHLLHWLYQFISHIHPF